MAKEREKKHPEDFELGDPFSSVAIAAAIVGDVLCYGLIALGAFLTLTAGVGIVVIALALLLRIPFGIGLVAYVYLAMDGPRKWEEYKSYYAHAAINPLGTLFYPWVPMLFFAVFGLPLTAGLGLAMLFHNKWVTFFAQEVVEQTVIVVASTAAAVATAPAGGAGGAAVAAAGEAALAGGEAGTAGGVAVAGAIAEEAVAVGAEGAARAGEETAGRAAWETAKESVKEFGKRRGKEWAAEKLAGEGGDEGEEYEMEKALGGGQLEDLERTMEDPESVEEGGMYGGEEEDDIDQDLDLRKAA